MGDFEKALATSDSLGEEDIVKFIKLKFEDCNFITDTVFESSLIRKSKDFTACLIHPKLNQFKLNLKLDYIDSLKLGEFIAELIKVYNLNNIKNYSLKTKDFSIDFVLVLKRGQTYKKFFIEYSPSYTHSDTDVLVKDTYKHFLLRHKNGEEFSCFDSVDAVKEYIELLSKTNKM